MKHWLFLLLISGISSLLAGWQDELREKILHSNFPPWMLEQIREDLAPFVSEGIKKEDIQKTIMDDRLAFYRESFVLCRIEKNKFSYSPELPASDSRGLALVSSLKSLCETIPLPDVEFIVYTSEAFLGEENIAPIFTWCKHLDRGRKSIYFPDYEALNGNYTLLKEVNLGMMLYPWSCKKNSAIWRGNLTGGWGESKSDYMQLPRVQLAKVSTQFPELIDAKLTGQIGNHDTSEIRIKTKPYVDSNLSVSSHLQYKYQILVDGHVSAFSGAYWRLFSNCVIFKQTSPWSQWFYRELRPYENYIPYRADSSDLVEKIKWAMHHDNETYNIALNALHFANENLKHSDVMLYVYLLLNEYAKIQVFK